jgi:2-C-methyl-D-erythritol 4-phosphate cytidylyltransferase
LGYSVIVLAAGNGSRFGEKLNKIFIEINGKKVLDYSLQFFKKINQVDELILVVSETDFNYCFDVYNGVVDHIIIGGKTRQDSVFKALNTATNDYVVIHDSARPFINKHSVEQLFADVIDTKASSLAIPVKDTIVETTDNRLTKGLDRDKLVALQTPQAFLKDLILEAHLKARSLHYVATDDTALIRKFTDVMPSFVPGDYRSVKLTTKEDVPFLEAIL